MSQWRCSSVFLSFQRSAQPFNLRLIDRLTAYRSSRLQHRSGPVSAVELQAESCWVASAIFVCELVAGYPPALAAIKKLVSGGLIQEKLPGKAGGEPGNTFDLVYATKRDKVYQNLYHMDPVIAEWIRCHCYGDIYSSPGLSLTQKQLLISGFLAEANMHDEFFGHVIAGLRFGGTLQQFLETISIAFEVAGSKQQKLDIYSHAVRLAEKAAYKIAKDFPEGVPLEPQISINCTNSLRIPQPPAPLAKAYFEE